MAIFNGFSASDFAAFEEKKWGSNAFTLERMKVKDKLAALQSALAPIMTPHADAIAGHLTDEHPSIMNHKRVDTGWLYYTRTENHSVDLARFLEKTELKPDTIFNIAAQEKHVALAVIVDHKAVQVGLFIHPGAFVDRRNFAAKLDHSWDREKLKQVMEGLDPELTLGFDDTERVIAREMELPAFTWLADTLAADERRFSVARTFTADEAITMGSAFGDMLVRMFSGLVELYNFVAWTRANDQIQVAPQIQKAKVEQRKNSTEFKAGDKVKITGGMFAGKTGNVQSIDTKAYVKVIVGKLSVNVAASDLTRS